MRAVLVAQPQDWQWSSYNFYAFGKEDSLIKGLIDIEPYYLELGNGSEERKKRYRENISEVMKEDFLKNIRRQLNEGVFGRMKFVQTMKEKFEIRSLRGRGRPRRKGEK